MRTKNSTCGLRAIVTVLAIAAAIPTLTAMGVTPARAQSSALTQVDELQLSPRLRELTLRTQALATQPDFILGANPTGQTKVRVLLPHGYDLNETQRYPVLYLFHGGGGNHTVWTSPPQGDAEGITAGLPLIVVMPDGGIAGGYADWYNNGTFGPPMWKTYHLDQLIPWVDAHYRTIANRDGRAAAGLSMGGGGLRYAAQRPDLIGITASFSGDIDITQPASDWRGAGAVISRLIWGDFTTQELRWRGVNGPDLARNLSNTDVSIFSGDTGHPEGTYILGAAVRAHERLEQLGIQHEYVLYPGMSHNWTTFNRGFADWLPRLMEQFANSATTDCVRPSNVHPAFARRWDRCSSHTQPFSYSTIEPTYSIYGWTVQIQRNALEFSALEIAGAREFDVVGSGSADVKTPKLIAPNIEFLATMTNTSDATLNATEVATTDADGRLSMHVPLAAANPFQQYTTAANAASTGPSTDEVPFLVFNNGSRFYRANVTISATPTGLCQTVRVFTPHKGTVTSLCNLMRDFEKYQSHRMLGGLVLFAFRVNVVSRIGKTLTQEQAATLLTWANTL